MKTLTQLRASFWQMLEEAAPELAAMKRSRKTQNDYCTDIRCAWVDYVDQMHRDGQITESLAGRATL